MANEFNFNFFITDKESFTEEYLEEETKNWTEEDFRKAIASLEKELGMSYFYAVSDIVESINSVKN